MNHQFTFESKQRTLFISMMLIGIASMLYTYFAGGEYAHLRFWTNYLHNAVFFTGISFLALFFYACKILAYSGWHTTFKRVMEAMYAFLPVGLLLMVVVVAGNYLHWHHLYHWTDEAAVASDELLKGKSGFLNKTTYAVFTILVMCMWIFFAFRFRSLSLNEDNEGSGDNYSIHRSMRGYAAVFVPLGGFSSAAIIWLWIMSIDAHWYSTMFAWYTTSSWLVSCVAIIVLMIIYLKSKNYLEYVTNEHLHDLGKYAFGFSVFWTYLWFSQYMLIWYANVGEETVYFQERIKNYPVLFYGNLVINFVLPFLILMRNDTKRKFGTIGFASALVLFGHWFDFFQMIKPGTLLAAREHEQHAPAMQHGAIGQTTDATAHAVSETAHAAEGAHGAVSSFFMGFDFPGLLEIGTFIGFAGLFLWVVFSALTKASLVPKNDPYINESINHHVL